MGTMGSFQFVSFGGGDRGSLSSLEQVIDFMFLIVTMDLIINGPEGINFIKNNKIHETE